MKRLLGQTLAIVAAGLLATAVTPACAENDQSLFVRMVIAPPANCTYTSDATQAFISEGTLDVALTETYTPTLLVGNQLIQRGDQQAPRTEPNRVHIQGAVVRLTEPNGGTFAEFTTVTSGLAEPSENGAPSYCPTGITAIDQATSRRLRDRLVASVAAGGPSRQLLIANIKVFGKTLGGIDVESGEFQFPITVCSGCLVDFSKGDDPAVEGTDCNLPLAEGGTVSGGGCHPGNDVPIACQACKPNPACVSR